MAIFSVEIPDEHAARLIASMCGLHDYENAAEEGEDPAAFANRKTREYLAAQVARWEAGQAAKDAAIEAEKNRITIIDPNRKE